MNGYGWFALGATFGAFAVSVALASLIARLSDDGAWREGWR